jgi:hypothetical protein
MRARWASNAWLFPTKIFSVRLRRRSFERSALPGCANRRSRSVRSCASAVSGKGGAGGWGPWPATYFQGLVLRLHVGGLIWHRHVEMPIDIDLDVVLALTIEPHPTAPASRYMSRRGSSRRCPSITTSNVLGSSPAGGVVVAISMRIARHDRRGNSGVVIVRAGVGHWIVLLPPPLSCSFQHGPDLAG